MADREQGVICGIEHSLSRPMTLRRQPQGEDNVVLQDLLSRVFGRIRVCDGILATAWCNTKYLNQHKPV
jgi:hypothetical protein